MNDKAITTGMPLFRAVQIQTHTRCNFQCKFCPHGKIPLQHGEMGEQTFAEVVKQLGALEFDGDIYPYLMNEPLLDGKLPERVAMLRAACPNARIWVDTNSSLATTELVTALVRAGATVVNLELYLPPGKRVPEKYLRLYAELPDDVRQRVFLYERDSEAVLTNRAGNLPDRPIPNPPYRLCCERPFRQIYIAYDGSLLLCCQDYRREAILGNLREKPLAEIWQSEAYAAYRRELLKPGREITLCRKCDYSGRPQDMPAAYLAGIPLGARLRWRLAEKAAVAKDLLGNRMFMRALRGWYRRRIKGRAARIRA